RLLNDELGVREAFRARSLVRHHDAEDVLRSQRLGGEHRAEAGIDAARESDDDASDADFLDFVADEGGEYFSEQPDVGGNLDAHQRLFFGFFPRPPRPLLPLITRNPLTTRAGFRSEGRSRMRSSSFTVRSISSSRSSGAAARLRRTASSAMLPA